MDLYPGLCISNLDPLRCVYLCVWGLDGWKIGPSVSEGVFVSYSGRKRRGSVMEGESRGDETL